MLNKINKILREHFNLETILKINEHEKALMHIDKKL